MDATLAKKKQRADRVSEVRNALRDQVCVPPRYPGKSSDYVYSVREVCSRRDRSKAPRRPQRPAPPPPDYASDAQKLREFLQARYPKGAPRGQERIKLIMAAAYTGRMLAPVWRRKHPDPVERFQGIVKYMREKIGHTGTVPEYSVLSLTHDMMVAVTEPPATRKKD